MQAPECAHGRQAREGAQIPGSLALKNLPFWPPYSWPSPTDPQEGALFGLLVLVVGKIKPPYLGPSENAQETG